MSRVEIDNMTWGLNTAEPTKIKDNQFSVLQNMFYNADFWLQSRPWIAEFWNQFGVKAPTSMFSFVNDTTWDSWLIVTAWTSLYQYNEWTSNFDEVKTWLTEFETDWVTKTRWSFAVYEPKVRHLAFLWDAIYWGWADDNPNTLYFTNAWGGDWNNLDANSLVVWWDVSGRINWLNELQTQVQVFKDTEIRAVAWDWSSSLPTDTESGWYADRVIKKVWNSLLNLSERGIDTIRARNWVSGTQAIESKPLSDNVRDIFAKTATKNRKFACGQYILPLTNYYVTIDTTNDSIPESTLVYSSLTKGWSEYTYPAINDYTKYTDSDWKERFLMASANTGILYEMETGTNDVWGAIPVKLRTKKYDLKKPTVLKTISYVDVIWFKSEWDEIECNIYMEWELVWGATIDDSYINETWESLTIWTTTTWTSVIWGGVSTEWEIKLFPFVTRIPMYETGLNIEIELTSESTNMTWLLSKLAFDREFEDIDLFSYDNIA